MFRILCTSLLAILLISSGFMYSTLQKLQRTVYSQQSIIESLSAQNAYNVARADVALKVGIVNKATIQNLQRRKVVHVTAYSPRNTETDDTPFHTASNNRVRHGIIAVSRDLFDQGWVFGKKVYIKSLGIFTIDDLMAERKKNQIDIFMFETDKAIAFGRKKLEAHLLAGETEDCASDFSIASLGNVTAVSQNSNY